MVKRACQKSLILMSVLVIHGCEPAVDKTNEREVLEWSLSPQPVFSVGSVEGDPEYIFNRVEAVRILPGHAVAVADGGSATVRIYDAQGSLRYRMGRRGEGPGEFNYINDMWLRGPDTLLVYDARTYRVTRYSTDGRLLSTQSFRVADGVPNFYVGTLGRDQVLAWIKLGFREEDGGITADTMKIGRFGADGNVANILAVDLGMRRFGNPVPFSPHFLVGMVQDTIFHTDGVDGVVRRTGPDGESLSPVRFHEAPPDVDAAFADLEAAVDSFWLPQLARARETPGTDTIPFLSDMLVDDRDRVWLKLYEPETDSPWVYGRRTGGEWLIAERDGTIVGRIFMPPNFRLMEISRGRVGGVVFDELEVERVVVYRLREGEEAK